MKLPAGMNLSPCWLGVLTEAGFEALHWPLLGVKTRLPQKSWPTPAQTTTLCLLTIRTDFSAILAAPHGGKPGVVQICSEDISPGAMGKQIIAALRQMKIESADDALLTIGPNRTRLRLLPLQRKE
ncbi:DUF5615 family PIN-like protein [Thiobacillus denitrificans]|uniref:DUF5615 family PIN-like protein n=1 Tax=Thiobacillus denitrificans TaxID=36861 RepID=UPI001B7FD73F|nr:DUF5615 family PIN-like protein [Thiobacillus denitrificans]